MRMVYYIGLIVAMLLVLASDPAAESVPAAAWVPLVQEPPPDIVVSEFREDETHERYQMSVAITNPERVSTLVVDIVDKDTGIFVDGSGGEVSVDGRRTLVIPIEAANLKPDQEYMVRIKARDMAGNLWRRPDDNLSPTDAVILASTLFKHKPPPPSPVRIEINSVTADWPAGKLVISLDVQGIDEIASYEGFVNNKAGNEVAHFEGTRFSPQLPIDIPPGMREPEAREYDLTTIATTWDKVRVEASKSFTLPPAPQPSLGEQVLTVFRQYPIIFVISVVLATFVVAWYFLGRRRNKRLDPLAPPIFGQTGSMPRVLKPGVHVRVIRAPGDQAQTDWVVRHFPCIIGRKGSQPEGDLTIDDRRVSGQHVRIDLHGGSLLVTDLNSRNGTWLDGNQLEPKIPVRLARISCIRLGPDTELELMPEV